MLIPSHRHTAADLRLWAELEESDLVNGRSAALARTVERSMEEIRRFAAGGRFYVSVSGGKDSAVLSRLVAMAGVDAPMIHVSAGRMANPDTPLVLSRMGRVDIINVEYDPAASEADGDRRFFAALRGAGDRYMSGIRAEESSGRRMRMRKHGLGTPNTCAPLGWWTTVNVFAFAAVSEIALHPVYAMTGGGRWPRAHLRVDELGGSRGRGMGRAEWEREYYGDVIHRLPQR